MTSRVPLVSVIIPCKDRVDLLAETLRSVAEQSEPDIEAIVIDDASGDRSAVARVVSSIGRDLRHRPSLLRQEVNRGPGAAREIGRGAARGAFIAYLDSDDLWHPRFVVESLNALAGAPRLAMSYATTLVFSDADQLERAPIYRESDASVATPMLRRDLKRRWSTSSCLWTREATDAVGPWLPLRLWEDKEYEFRATARGIAAVRAERAVCYFRRSGTQHHLSAQLGPTAVGAREKAYALIEMAGQVDGLPEHDRRTGAVAVAFGGLQLVAPLLAIGDRGLAVRTLRAARRGAPTTGPLWTVAALATRFGGSYSVTLFRSLRRRLLASLDGGHRNATIEAEREAGRR